MPKHQSILHYHWLAMQFSKLPVEIKPHQSYIFSAPALYMTPVLTPVSYNIWTELNTF